MAYLGHGIQAGLKWCGRVHALEGEVIRTEFVFFGLPLFPTKSFYFLKEYGKERRGYRIPLHPGSVLAGYLRYWGFMGGVLGMAAAAALQDAGTSHTRVIELRPLVPLVSAVCLVAWVFSIAVAGRTGRREAARRNALRGELGFGADPGWLDRDRALGCLDTLRARAAQRSLPVTPEALRVAPDGAVQLAWAIAHYSERLEPEGGWRAAAADLESRLASVGAAGPGPIVAA